MTDKELLALVTRYTEACDDLGCDLFAQGAEKHKELHDNATELWTQIQTEVQRLHAELTKCWRMRMEFGDIISNQCIAMQAAVIDAKFRSPAEGMEWIENTLCGPGLMPDMAQARAMPTAVLQTASQAWFDAKSAEHEALRATRPAPEALAAGAAPVLSAASRWS